MAGDPLDLPPPPPPALVARLLDDPAARPDDNDAMDTMPLALIPAPRTEETPVHALETPPCGLRTFDLGTVPASVTPPRSWRRAAWFAVGTSAAVVCALVVATVQLVGAPWPGRKIDALPSYPSWPLEIEDLPIHETPPTAAPSPARHRNGPSSQPRRSGGADTVRQTEGTVASRQSGSPPVRTSWSGPGAVEDESFEQQAAPPGPPPPRRTTVGSVPATPTDPQVMGDRTEQYFALVTQDPKAAHELCTGELAAAGPGALEDRYAGIEWVEVQEIVIDREQAITTSTVRVVYADGTQKTQRRQLTFTLGPDPRISGETITSR